MDKPEALRLADGLQYQSVWERHYGQSHLRDLLLQAEAELRRLHAENERLTSLCYDYLGQITAPRAAEQMSKQIAAISKDDIEWTDRPASWPERART